MTHHRPSLRMTNASYFLLFLKSHLKNNKKYRGILKIREKIYILKSKQIYFI